MVLYPSPKAEIFCCRSQASGSRRESQSKGPRPTCRQMVQVYSPPGTNSTWGVWGMLKAPASSAEIISPGAYSTRPCP